MARGARAFWLLGAAMNNASINIKEKRAHEDSKSSWAVKSRAQTSRLDRQVCASDKERSISY